MGKRGELGSRMFKTEHLGSELSRQRYPELQDPVSFLETTGSPDSIHWPGQGKSTLDQAAGARKYPQAV